MGKLVTHYDNLKVARSAPPAVIKAAYRALAQQYHPDVNKDPDASRIMQLVNRAYEVLSNPDLRAEHDAWIRDQERSYPSGPAAGAEWAYTPPRPTSQASAPPPQPPPQPAPAPSPGPKPQHQQRQQGDASLASRAMGVLILIGVLAFLANLANKMFKDNGNPKPAYSYREPSFKDVPPPIELQSPKVESYEQLLERLKKEEQAEVERVEAMDPTLGHIAKRIGQSRIPYSPAYIQDEPYLRSDGLSSVTIDNTQNDSDVLVKLFSLDVYPAAAVRTFYIPKLGRFKVSDVTAGNYDVRYLDGTSGAFSKSEPFVLAERQTDSGVEYDNMSMTLYKVVDGNMQTERINESDF